MELLLFLTALFVLLAASITDLKTREVPDWLNFSLLFAALGIRLLISYHEKDYSIFAEGIFGFAVLFAFACFLFYTGQWGGGDSKLLMALGAVFGLRYTPGPLLYAFIGVFVLIFALNLAGGWATRKLEKARLKAFNIAITLLSVAALIMAATIMDFRSNLLMFLFYLILLGGLYGIGWSVYLAVLKRRRFSKSFIKLMKKPAFINARRFILTACLLLIALSFAFDFTLLALFVTLFAIITMYLWIAVKAIEISCMEKEVEVVRLTEGDWIVKDVIIDDKRVCGPADLGISKDQIRCLKEHYDKGRIRKVRIKEGIPFVPSFLLAFIATYLLADISAGIIY